MDIFGLFIVTQICFADLLDKFMTFTSCPHADSQDQLLTFLERTAPNLDCHVQLFAVEEENINERYTERTFSHETPHMSLWSLAPHDRFTAKVRAKNEKRSEQKHLICRGARRGKLM